MMNTKLLSAAVMAALCTPALAIHDSQQGAQNAQGTPQQAQQQQQQAQRNAPRVISAGAPDYTASMERLLDASQRLREAIQAMAQQDNEPGRNRAIDAAHKALFDAQRAMVALPPELRTGAGSDGAPNESRALDRLRQAADHFRESIQAMAQQPAGPGRNQAARSALEGLLETQMAMINLPSVTQSSASQSSTGSRSMDRQQSQAAQQTSQQRSRSEATATGGTQTARGQAGATTFESLDRDGDGYISMMESAADADATRRFKERDRNRDYRLSRSEWDATDVRTREAQASAESARREQVLNPTTFAELDRDNDGYVGMMEAAADPDATQRFKERDLNRDYRLSRSEWERTAITEQSRSADQQRAPQGDGAAADVAAAGEVQRDELKSSR